MNRDAHSFTAPSRVKVLVVPIGAVKQSRLRSFLHRIEHEKVIRLGDISPDGRPDRNMFSPLAFPDGLVQYELHTSSPSPQHLELAPFEVYRIPFVVLGLRDGQQIWEEDEKGTHVVNGSGGESTQGHDARLMEQLEDMIERYPFALVHRALVFDHDDPADTASDDVVFIPSIEKSRVTTMKTVMCDITAALLAELSGYAKSLQDLSSLETPKFTNDPSGVNNTSGWRYGRSSRPTSTIYSSAASSPMYDTKGSQRMSMPPQVLAQYNSSQYSPSSRNQSPIARPSSTGQSLQRERRNSESQDQRPASAASVGTVTEREKARRKARIGMVIGALYLQAGRWPDAMKELTASAASARANSDYVWQARATDLLIVCLLVCWWAGMDFRIPEILTPSTDRPSIEKSHANHSSSVSQNNITPPQSVNEDRRKETLHSLSTLIPDILHNNMNLYIRAYTFTDDKIPHLSYYHSVIRYASLLSALHRTGGYLNQEKLNELMNGSNASHTSGSFHETTSRLRKADIAALLLRAYPDLSHESTLSRSEQINILASVAAILSELGYHRKKATILKDIVTLLLPALVQARKDGAAEMGLHPAASLTSLDADTATVLDSHSTITKASADQGIRHFLLQVCRSFGTILDNGDERTAMPAMSENSEDSLKQAVSREILTALDQSLLKFLGPSDIRADVLRSCINVCEALPDLVGALQFSMDLLRNSSSVVAPAPESSNGTPGLPIEEQIRLANNIARTLSAAVALGYSQPKAAYWDVFLVRSVALVPNTGSHVLTHHVKADLDAASGFEVNKNPFIYNPFVKSHTSSPEPVLVVGEEAIFDVMLQNLFDFDITVEDIVLYCDSNLMHCSPQTVLVGPYRTQTMRIPAVPQKAGNLVISGCAARVRGCSERMFPIFQDSWEFTVDPRGRNLNATDLKTNVVALVTGTEDERKKARRHVSAPVHTSLSLNAIESQPILGLKSIPLTQSSVMLLDGESQNVSIVLQNLAKDVPADLVLISFTDSVSNYVRQRVTEGHSHASELYEMELDLANRPCLRRSAQEDGKHNHVSPGGDIHIEVEMFGKPSFQEGSVEIEYGFIEPQKTNPKGRIYTRHLSIPIHVTVNASLELVRNDILPYHHSEVLSTISSSLFRQQHLDPSEPHCLVLLDFRNSWPGSLVLQLRIPSTSDDPLTIEEVVQPGKTIRVPVILPRIYLPTSSTSSPIPVLNPENKRQFVLSATQASPAAERDAREAFWYREALLKSFSATWQDPKSKRSGEINMRALRLNPRMLAAYKLDDIGIDLSILNNNREDDSFKVPISEFITLRTRLHNRSHTAIHPFLRLQPALAHQIGDHAVDLARKLLVHGSLQQPLQPLPPHGEIDVVTSFVVLSPGEYEWTASVEQLSCAPEPQDGKRRARAQTGEVDLRIAQQGRRVWYVERPCVVLAR